MLSHLRLQCKFANVRLFRGLSALPAPCPYRAEQATGLAGGYDCVCSSLPDDCRCIRYAEITFLLLHITDARFVFGKYAQLPPELFNEKYN